MKNILFVFVIAFLIFAVSCNSVPKEIPEDLDARQLIQLGQDSYDAKRYKAAEVYFNEVLKRFGDDAKHYVEATYELGHLYLRRKNYDKAYKNFNEILEIYESVPAGLPGAYKKLCQIELKKIPQKALDAIAAKKAAQEADLAAEAEKVRQEEEARKAKEAEKEAKRPKAKPLPTDYSEQKEEPKNEVIEQPEETQQSEEIQQSNETEQIEEETSEE